MLEPNGPLPPEIYWRRRGLAVGVAVIVIGLVVWLIVSLGGGSSDDTASTAVSATLLTPVPTYSPDASAQADDSFNGGGSAGGGGSSGGSGGTASESSAAATTTTAVVAGQCPDQSLAVKASPDQASFVAGAEPKFTIVVTNIGTSQCSRDLGSGLQQVLVYTLQNQRLWSNIDCFPSTTPDVRTLGAGQQATFTVTWSSTTSEPGCTAPRNPIGPGAYSVVGQLGELRSAPETFNIT